MNQRLLICTVALSLMLTGAAYAKDDHSGKNNGKKSHKEEQKWDKESDHGWHEDSDDESDDKWEKKTGLENAWERGNKSEAARDAIRRALERKLGELEKEWTAKKRVEADAKALEITFGGNDTTEHVTQAIGLPWIGSKGSTITWTSSNPAVISNDGQIVNRPAAGQGDAVVILTATVTYGGESTTRTFKLTVKELINEAQRVAADKAALTITLNGNDTAGNVTQPITLPVKGANGSTITWVSSNPSIISNDGKTIQRPAAGQGDASVILTATISYGGASDTKSFALTVKQLLTDAQRVAADKAALTIGYNGTDSAGNVTQALILPTVGVNGSSVSWFSSYTAVISNDGKTVNRPAAGQGDVNVVLTAIVSAGGYTETKSFTVTVKQQLTDAQRAAADKEALAIGYNGSDSASNVTQALNLPTSGTNGSAVTWISSNPYVISNDGKTVNRPAAGQGDVTVVMNAWINAGGYVETKSFTLTVKQQLTDAGRVAADKAALTLTYSGSDSASWVTGNLTLPAKGPNGSQLVWVSSNTNLISNTGVVTRPAAGSGDVSVVLTAVITSGGYADTKAFVLTVKQLP